MDRAAFYTVADARYFLGAVGLINSLRLVGHDEPIHVLDIGLTERQRELLDAEVNLIEGPAEIPGNLLKGIAPRRHPASSMVLADADVIVTRRLADLIDSAADGNALAFGTGMERSMPQWGELLGGDVRPTPYLCSALVFCGGSLGDEIVRVLDDHAGDVDWELTYWRQNVDEYPYVHADQDLMNAALSTRADPTRVTELDGRLLASPPFAGLRVEDERTLRCAYADGSEPLGIHHWNAKPWLERTHHGVYSRLLRRLLVGPDVAIRVPDDQIPLRLRTGPFAWAERTAVNARERLRWHVAAPLAARARRARGAAP
ncbi:MAG TPA: hypothetical protein VFY99_03270 [Solirubrobacterales bacterium]